MSESFAPDEFVAALEDTFGRGQELTFVPTGRSMRPLLNGSGDKVTLSPKPDRLRKYDVAFYRRPDSGKLVLHRIVGFDRDGGYIFSGDGQYTLERGIRDEDVLAVMSSFTHNGREHGVAGLRYGVYSRLIVMKKRPRRIAARIYHKLFRS